MLSLTCVCACVCVRVCVRVCARVRVCVCVCVLVKQSVFTSHKRTEMIFKMLYREIKACLFPQATDVKHVLRVGGTELVHSR